MKKVITYGTYDLLHQVHINILRRAKELGDYLIVGVTNDSFDRDHGKLNVRKNVLERVKEKSCPDYVLLLSRAGHQVENENTIISLFVIQSNLEIMQDMSRQQFLHTYLNQYVSLLNDNASEEYLPRNERIQRQEIRGVYICRGICCM